MHEQIHINNLIIAVIFTALGVILPVLFHLLGLGPIFMPMFLPLAIGAFLVTPSNALIMGFFTPLLSAILTGMPPFYPPIAGVMVVELTLFCALISILTHRTRLPLLIVLVAAIVCDRLVLVILYSFVMPLFDISAGLFSLYDIARGIPGIILMLLLVPVMVRRSRQLLARHSLRLYEHSDHSHGDNNEQQ